MTKNVKIALGCGGAGCLGLIVLGVAGVLLYYFMGRTGGNYNSNSNSSYNRNANISTNRNSNDSSSNSNSGSSSASSMSDDDKHKLYQAAATTGDQEIIRRVSVKLGLMNDDFTPGDEYASFLQAHAVWLFSNTDFLKTINSKEKAVAYVNQHFPD